MRKKPKRKDSTSPYPWSGKTVILTGGGSGGHLFPLQTLAKELKKQGAKLIYLGRNHPLERDVMGGIVDDFYPIAIGKLRRNWSFKIFWSNFIDGFNFFIGLIKCFILFGRLKQSYPRSVLFSSGGFVAVSPVIASFFWGIPGIVHEQTARAGLANRISALFAKTICTSFQDSDFFFSPKKTVYTGFPLREEFYQNSPSIPKRKLDGHLKQIIESKKPVILFSGGGNGSQLINKWVRKHLRGLLKKYVICHQTGQKFIHNYSQIKLPRYFPLGFISSYEWPLLLKRADVVVGRSGAGIVHECIHLNKKVIFIPLDMAQKDEQFHNALQASRTLPSIIVPENQVHKSDLNKLINEIIKKNNQNRGKIKKPLKKSQGSKPLKNILELLLNHIPNRTQNIS